MGKRSDFRRSPRDFYPTPAVAVEPLLPHLGPGTRFDEPCAGNGALVNHLEGAGHVCIFASDIEPQRDDIDKADALAADVGGDVVIMNPPFTRKILHELIPHWSDQAPTWLLLDTGWVHTQQSAPFLPRLRTIVSVGRVKWFLLAEGLMQRRAEEEGK